MAMIGAAFHGIMVVASSACRFAYNAFIEVFPLSTDNKHLADTQVSERSSQTGNGVWAFVTNLFKSQGRTYVWQSGFSA